MYCTLYTVQACGVSHVGCASVLCGLYLDPPLCLCSEHCTHYTLHCTVCPVDCTLTPPPGPGDLLGWLGEVLDSGSTLHWTIGWFFTSAFLEFSFKLYFFSPSWPYKIILSKKIKKSLPSFASGHIFNRPGEAGAVL